MTELIANIHEAKTNLSALLQKVEAGEDVIIARAGQPVARLSKYKTVKKPLRQLGGLADKIWMADDWDSPETNAFIGNYELDKPKKKAAKKRKKK